MKDKYSFATWLIIVIGIVSGSLHNSYASDIGAFFDDPLRVSPPVLFQGPLLPGDEIPLQCATDIQTDQPLTLEAAVDLALCNSPQIKSTWASIRSQASAVGEARAAYLPTLNGSISELRSKTRYPGFGNADSTTNGQTVFGSLSWRLYDFGGRSANNDAANKLLAAALATHDAGIQKLLAQVIGAYFDAITSQASAAARHQSAMLAQATLAASQRRESKGAAALGDTLQARAALAKAELEKRRAEGNYRKAVATLVYDLGVPTATHFNLPIFVDELTSDEIDDVDIWLEYARIYHPAIVSARDQWEAAQAKQTVVRSEGLPALDLTNNYYQNGYPNQALQPTKSNTTTQGISLSLPLFEGFARTYKIQGAQAQAEQAKAQLDDTEHSILNEIVKAHADAISAVENVKSSRTLLQAAQDAVNSAQNRYGKGAANILEVLNAQTVLADAQQERLRCLADWQSARLRLMANVGLLGHNNVVKNGQVTVQQP